MVHRHHRTISYCLGARQVFKAAGNPCDLFSEHLRLNPGSFTTTAGVDSDDWRTTASIAGTPANSTHVTDSTAYSTQPAEDSWYTRLNGSLSPAAQAKASPASSGVTRGGQLT